MKKNSLFILIFTAFLSILGLIARYYLYAAGIDLRGLLVGGTPASYLLIALTAAMVIPVILAIRWDCHGLNPPAIPRITTMLLAVALVISSGTQDRAAAPILQFLHWILSWAAALGLAFAGVTMRSGKKPPFACYLLAALFFVEHAIMRYQSWSSDPQIADYIFALLGCLCMSLFSYQMAAHDLDIGNPKLRKIFGLFGCFFSCVSLYNGEFPGIYLMGALWMLTCALPPIEERN